MTGNAVKSIYLTEAAQKRGAGKRIMEKDLKDKKPAENAAHPKYPGQN